MVLDKESHFIRRKDYYKFLGFDIFMDHSCNPSTYQCYISETEYEVYAARDIQIGDKLTCDYACLENQFLRLDSIPTSEFQCKCGSDNCRGLILG
jgi:SET domain-containing protein